MEEEEEEGICCRWKSRGWTRVIAWLHIILSVISIIYLAFLIAVSSADLGNVTRPLDSSLTHQENLDKDTIGLIDLFGTIILLVLSMLALVMATSLLRGSINKNPRQIQGWMVYTVILLVYWVVMNVAVWFFVSSDQFGLVATLFKVIIVVVTEGICLRVVSTHKKELEASAQAAGYPAMPERKDEGD